MQGLQGLQAVNTMGFIALSLRGWSVPLVLPVAQSWQSLDPDGHLKDEAVAAQLRRFGAEVVPCNQVCGIRCAEGAVFAPALCFEGR